MEFTDSEMVKALIDRLEVTHERAVEIADAILLTHGRVDVQSLSLGECHTASILANALKELDG